MRPIDLQPYADRINAILAVGVADARPFNPFYWTEDELGRRIPASRFRCDLSEYLVWAVLAVTFLEALPISLVALKQLIRWREWSDPIKLQGLVEDLVAELERRSQEETYRVELRRLAEACPPANDARQDSGSRPCAA